MRILQFNSRFDFFGGAEKHYISLTDLLTSNGYDVYRVGIKYQKNDKLSNIANNSKEIPIVFGKISDPRLVYSQFKSILNSVKPDIVHIHNLDHNSLLILKALAEYNKPVIQTVHDYRIVCPSGWGVYKDTYEICDRPSLGLKCVSHRCIGPSKYIYYKFFKEKILNKYSNVIKAYIVPSKYLFNALTNVKGFDNVFHIYNFLDIKKYRFYGYKRYLQNQMLFVGRLSIGKGVYALLDAFKYLSDNADIPFKLKIIGSGPLKDKLNNFIVKNRLKNICLCGFLGASDLIEEYKKSHAVIVPSIWLENSPFVIYESLAIGKYVIGSNRGGVKELIEASGAGSTVNVLDTNSFSKEIINVLEFSESHLNKVSKRGRLFAEKNFDKKKYLKKIIKLYSSLL